MRTRTAAVLLLAWLFGPLAYSQEPIKVGEIMRAKLNYAQKVLEGIAVEDYAGVADHAQKLSLLTLETNWNVLMTPDYLQHSLEFRRSADAVRDSAKQKNLDGATLAYVEMTMKCVHCHKHVRKVRMARGGRELNIKELAGQ